MPTPAVAASAGRSTMIMGLDVTYQNKLYRALVHPPLRSAAR